MRSPFLVMKKGTCTDLDTQVALPKGAVRGSARHGPKKIGIDFDHLLHRPRCCEEDTKCSMQWMGNQSFKVMACTSQESKADKHAEKKDQVCAVLLVGCTMRFATCPTVAEH